MKSHLLVLCFALLLSACGPAAIARPGQPAQPDVRVDLQATAQAEATAIIEGARATAIVLEAQAQAQMLLQQSQTKNEQELLEELSVPMAEFASPEETLPPFLIPFTPPAPVAAGDVEAGEAQEVQILNAGIAAEGGFIIINYIATYRKAQDFWPGRVSVFDETSGVVYSEVPVMPIIGPLIARPQKDGQPGYIMFVNNPPVGPGTLFTVTLDDYVQEHVPLE